MKPLRVVMIYGEMSSRGRGPYDIEGLYKKQGLTGSESSFFNLARGLAALGHQVVTLVDCAGPQQHESGFLAMPIAAVEGLAKMQPDVCIAWNEPDYLRHAPPGVLRMCDQQLNDFRYVQGTLCHLVDPDNRGGIWVSPAQNHLDYLTTFEGMPIGGSRVIPNSVDLGFYVERDVIPRNPKKVVWCSSPDRGLHHLLSLWPAVRARVPDAELHVFYRLQGWLNDVGAQGPWLGTHPDVCESARRARYVDEALLRLKDGWGVTVRDSVPNVEMARELMSAGVLAYTCDPRRYTEGFGVSALDAAAAGCHVLITDRDAMPSVHGEYATIIPGPPEEMHLAWVEAIVASMDKAERPRAPERYTHAAVAKQWEQLIREQLAFRAAAADQPAEVPAFTHPEVGRALRVRERTVGASGFRFWETDVHGSWWSMEDEQGVRDRHWHPKAGDMVIDGGAAFGSYALPALAAGARVVAFSPADPDTQCLVANIDLNPDFAGRFMLTRDGLAHTDVRFDPNKSRYLEPSEPSVAGELRCRALDAWLAEHPEIDRVDWIKLDVEGAELDALRGAEMTLRTWKPKLLIECHDFHRPMLQPVADYVLGLGLGYKLEAHPHGGVSHAYFEAQ